MRIRKRKAIPATRNPLTASREKLILSVIGSVGKTFREISLETRIPEGRVRYALAVLHRAELVHVSGWPTAVSADGKNRTTPQFMAGKDWDQRPPGHVHSRSMNLRIEPEVNLVQSVFFLWIGVPDA